MVDTRIQTARSRFYPRAEAVFKNRGMVYTSKRVFLQETLQAPEWGLETCGVSDAALRILESEERHYMELVCRWANYPPERAARQHDPPLTVSYTQYLKFFGFAPFRLRLRCTRLRFVWRILHSDARLARAVLLGSFSFEQERVHTDWDALLDADLALLTAHYVANSSPAVRPVPASREEWFEHMAAVSYEAWAQQVAPLLTTSVTVPRPSAEVARDFQCPSCPEGFPSHAELAAHRVRVHRFVDDAVEYWRTNKGTCPFCR